MKAYLINTLKGTFVLDDTGSNILVKHPFSDQLEQAATEFISLQKKGEIPRVEELARAIREAGIKELVVEDSKTVKNLKDPSYEVVVQSPNEVGRKIRDDLTKFLSKLNITPSEHATLQRELNFLITRKKIKVTAEGIEGKDRFIIQAIETIDQLDKSINILVSRLREWYGLHFPELDKKVQNHLRYAKYAQLKRTDFNVEKLLILGISREMSAKAIDLASKSMGSEMGDFDFETIKDFAQRIEQLYLFRGRIAEYVEELMKAVAPNVNGLVGPLLGARLISLGGGISTLAKKPSSTMQILGAERALFRSLKTGARPPKHGVIFQWDPIHTAKWWLRGKIARALASKLTIAVRVDAYSGHYIADNLLADLKQHIDTLEKKYANPPKKAKKVTTGKKDRKKKKWKKKRRPGKRQEEKS